MCHYYTDRWVVSASHVLILYLCISICEFQSPEDYLTPVAAALRSRQPNELKWISQMRGTTNLPRGGKTARPKCLQCNHGTESVNHFFLKLFSFLSLFYLKLKSSSPRTKYIPTFSCAPQNRFFFFFKAKSYANPVLHFLQHWYFQAIIHCSYHSFLSIPGDQ